VLPSIEPIYKNIYVKSNQGGEFIIVNDYLVEELKANKLWDYEMLGKIKYHDGSIKDISEIPAHIKEKYKEVFEIDPVWLIRAAAYRGKWIDQSQSLNIFFKGTSGKDISNLYLYAWEAGLKTTYYLRTLAISQVEKSTVSTAEYGSTHKREFLAMKLQTMPQQQAAPVAASVNSGQAASVVEKIEEAIASVQAPSLSPSFASASSAPAPKIYTAKGGPKLCAIEDPTCEACQ
jgi:ribonucleoside-diphosphate reductase alpha chain